MSRKPKYKKTEETIVDLNSEISLELTEKDLKNPGVARRILVDNKNLQQEIATVKESLKISQNSFEKLREKYHESDKNNAILQQKVAVGINFEIIKSLSLIGVGSAITLALNQNYLFAAILGVLSLIIFLAAVIRRDMKIEKK